MQVPPFSLEKQLSEMGSELDSAVLAVLRSGQYIGGHEIKVFEECFAKYLGLNNVVSCNSGTDALILALQALEIGKGDEVITPSFSFFATAEAISNVGAKPVFIDVETSGYLIDINSIEEAITSKTKAILPVHLFGCSVDMDQLMSLADKYCLKVIEDCAQAAGAKWRNKSVGSWGHAGCFSFFPTKNLGAAGDGGAVSTNHPAISKKIRELAVHGMPKRYLHTDLGHNSRLDSLQAAVLNVKLPRFAQWIQKRQQIALRYEESLKDVQGIEIPIHPNKNQMTHGRNQFVIKVKDFFLNSIDSEEKLESDLNQYLDYSPKSICRDWLKRNLEGLGVKTIIYYPIPIHLQPAYKSLGYSRGDLPKTEELCDQVLSLPIFPEITIEEQNHVIQSIKTLFNQLKI